MKYYSFYLFFLLIIYSCQEKKVIETAFLDQKKPAKTKIKWILKAENQSILNFDDKAINFTTNLYKNRNYEPMWVNDSSLTKQGEHILKILSNPLVLGLPKSRVKLNINDSTNLILKELFISNSLATLSVDLKYGFLDTVEKKCNPLSYPKLQNFESLTVLKSLDLKGVAQEIIFWGSNDTVYQKIANSLFKYALEFNLKDINYKVPIFKKDSLKSLNFAKLALFSKGYLQSVNPDSTTFDLGLKEFQLDNGLKNDGYIGQTTADALNETNLEKLERAAVVLEKLRWKSKTDKRYIEVNIPEYTLRFFADDTLKSVNRIIVGKLDTQTPEFEAELSTIIAYPYWSVPFSITSKEILPDAKKNANYFSRNNMKIYKKDIEIDPFSVNWKAIRDKTFPYKVIQQPGMHNSLGIIKFDFSNKYGVYFHDTPQKILFKTVIRSYSHGCMRCENPIDLAKIVLLKDENNTIPDSLDSILSRKLHYPIRLKKRIPIYITYRSVVSDEQGKLIFLRDIYKRDKRLAKMIFT